MSCKKTVALGKRILTVLKNEGDSIINPKKLIDGEDVMRILKCREGERVGIILKKIRELQLEKKVFTRKDAIEYLKKIKPEFS